ncbi:MAG: amidohydrolase [Acidobacteriota bacterium]
MPHHSAPESSIRLRLRRALPRVIVLSATLALSGAVLATSPAVRQVSGAPAELILRDGAVYTVDEQRSWAEAVAISGGRIAWVGADADAGDWIGPSTEVIDLDGKMVLPAFHDSHVHPVSGGIERGECDLNAAENLDEIIATLRACGERMPGPGWLRGGGWQLPIFPAANPRKELLDEMFPDRPVYLSAADGHSAWVSSAALELAGIDATTADPEGGRIERDPETGEPTGTLREAANGLVSRHLPAYDLDDHIAGLRRAQQLANSFGITSVIEANADRQTLEAYAALARSGELTLRVRASMSVDLKAGLEQIDTLRQQRETYRGDRLRAEAVKIFADGVIESHTAALLQPYLDTGDRGPLNATPAELDDLIVALDRAGFQIHVHAIGDRAIRVTLDALEAALRINRRRNMRPILAHIQLFNPRDIGRFAELGAIASFQPLWAYADSYITDLTEPVLGPERSRWLYPIASVAATGAVLACGSDWSVSSMNPLDGIQVAVTRTPPDSPDQPPWIPEERIDLATAIACYTINGAFAAFQESLTGSIEVGKAADLVVLERNLFEVPVGEIHAVRARLTMLDGTVVWRSPELPQGR